MAGVGRQRRDDPKAHQLVVETPFEKKPPKRRIQAVAIRLGIYAALIVISYPEPSWTQSLLAEDHLLNSSLQTAGLPPARGPDADIPDTQPESDNKTSSSTLQQEGLLRRNVRRVLNDQKELYTAPLNPSNIK